MNRHMTQRRTPSTRHFFSILIGMTLIGLLFSQLSAAGAAEGDAPPADPPPLSGTPTATGADAELPPEARAALEAFLAATDGVSLESAAAALPVDVLSSSSIVFLPGLTTGRQSGPPPTVTPTDEPEPEPEADVATRLWPDPSIRVIRGGTFVYEIRVKNHGDGDADQIRVKLPYRRDQFTLLEGRFDAKAGDWVSEVGERSITITFGKLRPGAVRSGRLFFRAASNLANDTILDIRATARFNGDGGRDVRSNWAPLLVGGGNASAPWVWTAIGPNSGNAATTFRVQSNRFIPGEEVVTWLNTPGGVKPLSLKGTADALGGIALSFSDRTLAPGTYQIVLYGRQSDLTGVASFTITR